MAKNMRIILQDIFNVSVVKISVLKGRGRERRPFLKER